MPQSKQQSDEPQNIVFRRAKCNERAIISGETFRASADARFRLLAATLGVALLHSPSEKERKPDLLFLFCDNPVALFEQMAGQGWLLAAYYLRIRHMLS